MLSDQNRDVCHEVRRKTTTRAVSLDSGRQKVRFETIRRFRFGASEAKAQ